MTSDLVERLRAIKPMADLVLPPTVYATLCEAADALERMENELHSHMASANQPETIATRRAENERQTGINQELQNELARQEAAWEQSWEKAEMKSIDEISRLRGALEKIAYEPFGPPDATFIDILAAITDCARAALKGEGE